MDTTKYIEDLCLSDFEVDAIEVATTGGPSALASFVLDYIRIAVDWRSLSNNLQSRSANGRGDLESRGAELEHQEQPDSGGPETG